MGIEGTILAIIVVIGGLAVLGPVGNRIAVSELPQRNLPDNRDIIAARNRHARKRFSRNWPEERRSQFL
ncbi:hypothetical protein KDL29_10915 [bacterium]|nr:hypothetical protein [bacterium]